LIEKREEEGGEWPERFSSLDVEMKIFVLLFDFKSLMQI